MRNTVLKIWPLNKPASSKTPNSSKLLSAKSFCGKKVIPVDILSFQENSLNPVAKKQCEAARSLYVPKRIDLVQYACSLARTRLRAHQMTYPVIRPIGTAAP